MVGACRAIRDLGTRIARGAGGRRPRRRLRSVAGLGAGLALLSLIGVSGARALTLVSSPTPPITVHVHPSVSPNRAGTAAHPQGVHLHVRVDLGYPAGYQPPIASHIDVWFPRGGLFEGGRYPTCRRAVLEAAGPQGCPRDTIVGAGVGDAMAGRSPTYPRLTLVNGGQRLVYFYVVLDNPAHVAEPLPGIVTPLHGRWSYELSVAIPKNLQIVAGTPIILHSLSITAGHDDWLATTSCPSDHRWPWKALGTFTNGQRVNAHGAVACRS